MCMSPSFAQTEDVCDYCMAAASGSKEQLIKVLEDHGWDEDDFGTDTGHEICSIDWDDASPVLNPCACRNSDHTLASPKAFYDKFFKKAMDKQREKLNV